MTHPTPDSDMTRRRALRLMAGGAAVSCLACGSDFTLDLADDADYDATLDALHAADPLLPGGATNHAPMGMDALVALGCGGRVCGWAEGYAKQLQPMPVGTSIALDHRQAALGDIERRADWVATWTEALVKGDPATVVAEAWPDLAAAVGAHAFHGLLRTAHAARALRRADTPARRRELAHGLGYWCAARTLLPGQPGTQAQGGFGVHQALAELTPLPASQQIRGGLITPRLVPALADATLVDVVARVDLSAGTATDQLSEVARAAARLFVADGGTSFAFLHGVTGTSMLRELAPWLSDAQLRAGVAAAWHYIATLHVAQSTEAYDPTLTAQPTSRSQLLAGVAAATEPHTFKLVDAALREDAATGDPLFTAAAQLWVGR